MLILFECLPSLLLSVKEARTSDLSSIHQLAMKQCRLVDRALADHKDTLKSSANSVGQMLRQLFVKAGWSEALALTFPTRAICISLNLQRARREEDLDPRILASLLSRVITRS